MRRTPMRIQLSRTPLCASNTCAADVPCNITYVNYLGFITIAVMAFTAFLLITLIMLGVRSAHRRAAAAQLPIPAGEGY